MKLAALALAVCLGTCVSGSVSEKGRGPHPLAFIDASATGDEAENKEESVKNVLARVQTLYLKMKETAGPLGEYKDFIKEMNEALGVMNDVRSGLGKNALTQNNPLAGFFLDSVNATYEQASDMMSVLQSYEATAEGLVDILKQGGTAGGAAGAGLVINGAAAGGSSSSGRMEIGKAQITQRRVNNVIEWTSVRFMQSFDAVPVVVLLPNRQGGSWPVSVRVKDVTRHGFSAAMVVPPEERNYARGATLPYLAATPGVHALPDGTVVEVGRHATTAVQHDPVCGKDLGAPTWSDVTFKAPFQSTPAVLTMVQTTENEGGHVPTLPSRPWMTVATSALRASGMKLALERTRVKDGKVEKPETIGYVAFQQGSGVFIQHDRKTVVSFEAFVTPAVVEGWQDSDELIQLRNPVNYRTHVAFASLATRNDPEGGWLRLHSSHASYIRLQKDKDLHCVSRRHAEQPEQASVVIFSTEGEVHLRPLTHVDLTATDHNAMAVSAVPSLPTFDAEWVKENNVAADKLRAPGVNMEISSHRMHTSRTPGMQKVDFRSSYRVAPMVFALPSSYGSNPAAVRIKDATTTSVMAAVVNPPASHRHWSHSRQTVPFIALEPGVHTLPDGTVVEAGFVDTVKSQADPHCVPEGKNQGWEHLKFKTEFVDPPAVLTFVQTMANEVNSIPEQPAMPWITSVHKDVTRTGFRLALDRSRVKLGDIAKPERVAYLAIEHRNGNFLDARNRVIKFAAESFEPLTQGWSNGCQNLFFRTRLGRTPLLVASKASRNNDAGGWPRMCRQSHHYFSLRMDTDTLCESQRTLPRGEAVDVLAFSQDFYLKADVLPPQNGRALLMGAGEDAQDANNEKDAAHAEAAEGTAVAGL